MVILSCFYVSQLDGQTREYVDCDGLAEYTDEYERVYLRPCSDDRLPIGIVNGRPAFAVHTTSSDLLDDLPF